MFKNLKIRTKIVLMPVLAGIAFLLILVINTFLGSKNNHLLVKIEDGYFPALEMSRELEGILTSVQRNMQYSASAMDEEILTETDVLRDKFIALVENSKNNPVLNQSELLFLEKEFSEYYPLARQTTLQMLNGELDEAVIQNLAVMQDKYNLIQEKLSTMTGDKKNDMAEAVGEAQSNQESIVTSIILITSLSLILMIFISWVFIRLITKPLHKIVTAANQLAKGNVNTELHIDQNDEIGELAKATSALVETNKQLSRAADAIGQGDYNVEIDIRSDEDILGKSIMRMKNNLLNMSTENEHDNWLKTGQAELSDKMRGDQNTIDLAQNVISYIAEYTKSQIGTIYLNGNGNKFKLAGSYAYKKRKNLSNEFEIGEGLIGQCALEKKTILITNVPDDYIQINSGVGERIPLSILVTPLLYDGKVHGVIELGAFHEFCDLEMNFLEQATENIAIAFHSAVARVKVKELLEETQNQAAELQAQQEELRVTNEELEEQTQNLLRSEEELKSQREELQASNEELGKQTEALKERQAEIEEKNNALETATVEIEKKAEELEVSSKYKSEFLANMSHELRTPLNSIQILSKLLMENKYNNLNEKQITFAKTINSSGSDLLNLINEILDLSKIEAGKMNLNLEDVALDYLPTYVKQNFEHLTGEKGLYLKVEMENKLPENIISDRQRIEQIVKNLLSNAIKFTEKGGITVKIGRPSKEMDLSNSGLSQDSSIYLQVLDTGIGIPEEKKDLIFQAFQQADGTTSRKFGGTGLGLSISLQLAKLMGGEIQVTSEVGKGSTFTLFLPETIVPAEKISNKIEQKKRDDSSVIKNREVEQTSIEETKKPAQNVNDIKDDRHNISEGDRSILIIEDDANFAKVLFDFTREKGYKSVIAEDGEAGLQLANQYKPSAILLDVGLPRIDGWTVMERLKDNAGTRHIPVYFISGHDKRMAAMNMGAIGYLQKPVSPEGLDSALSKIDRTISKDIKKLLIVEDDKVMRESIIELIGNGDVSITASDKGEHAFELLHKEEFDCMVLDLGLSDISGFELIEKVKSDKKIAELPIIIYTGKELNKKEETKLRKHSESIIVKGAKSPERLLDEVSLFLHRVEKNLPKEKQEKIRQLHDTGDNVFKNKKILLVDDDIRNIFALSSVLEEKDIEVITAENGQEAIDTLKYNDGVNLILMDIMMPEMDGFEAIGKIRKLNDYAKLPIIALTAKAMKGDRQKCIDAGANDYLSKPVDIEKLLSLLQVWLYK